LSAVGVALTLVCAVFRITLPINRCVSLYPGHVQATLEIILAAIDCLGKQGELDDCKKEMRK
jgi:hypothetical protein